MSNDVFLVGGDDPHAPGPLRVGSEYTYDYYGDDTLAGASYSVPVLWLFCFDLASLTVFDVSIATGEPGTASSAVIPIGRGRELLHGRSPLLETWPGLDRFYPDFVELIESCPFPYLKMDLFELDEMMDGLDDRLRAALAWFEAKSSAQRASMPMAPTRRRWRSRRMEGPRREPGLDALEEITCFRAEDDHASTMAHGFRCTREVPWQDAT